jgi:hypothetical protein
MIKLCYNQLATLVIIKGWDSDEYWIIKHHQGGNLTLRCYNSRSKTYGVQNALQTFELEYGKPSWVRENIAMY